MSAYAILKKLGGGIRYIENVLLVICGVIFMGMMFLGTADVLGRYAFDSPILGSQELMQVGMGALVMLGWAYTQKEDGHIKVDLFLNMFPKDMQKVLNIVMTFLGLFLFAAIAFKGWEVALANIHRHFLVIHFVSGPFYFLVPIGAFFLCLEFILHIFDLFNEMRGGKQNVNS
jgi:TRAP-type C4-dicarboxylate transport system permease small subunit